MIAVRGAAEHNLKAIDVDIPRGLLTVVTGVSGSGKSSLAFDTICAEGRRRYLDTFSSYARQFLARLSRPAATRIDGLSPAVAIDQSAVVRSPRSTVGTMTEIYDLMRLLWARAADGPAGGPLPSRALFSFNAPLGACPRCKGLGVEDALDPDLLVKDPTKSVREGALRITTPTGYVIYSQVTLDVLDQVCRAHGFSVDIAWQALTDEQRDIILNGSDRIRIPYGKHPLSSRLRWTGITARPREEGTYRGILPVMEQILRAKRNRNILRYVRSMPCRGCGGTRLRPEALAFTYRGLSIAQAAALSIDDLHAFFAGGEDRHPVGSAVGAGIVSRTGVLQRLGLGYLTVDRDSTTLSGGEAQRLGLARQAAIELSGVLYVLDEPSIGLHDRDTTRLIEVVRTIRDRGNTVLVVEHDEQVIRAADWIVDVGPLAGNAGGQLLYSGRAEAFTAALGENQTGSDLQAAASPTREFLTGERGIAVPEARRAGRGSLVVAGITRHNLSDVRVEFLSGAFNAVTGVSGAGKSTLVTEVARRLREGGGKEVDKIIDVDQSPIGRTPRSNPATYTGLFDAVRDLFAAQPEAVNRGFAKGRFSFNVKGGRCDACEGAGVQQVGMQFLGAAVVTCDTCGGRRFNEETLEVRYRGANIHDVLEMPIEHACGFFADVKAIARPLETMRELGVGYLALGHPATMLSGGEAQRVKLASELARPGTGRTLYILDEPTTGLHAADIMLLLRAIDGLVAKGNTVIAIEHHLDVIKVADWVVDLGPGSGALGGRIVVMGTPEAVAAARESVTGQALVRVLSRRAEALRHDEPFERTALRHDEPSSQHVVEQGVGAVRHQPPIRLTNVTTHNLQHVDVEIPARRLTAITGVSGSGKSSLAFDTLFAEGQQRFAETFSTYARRFVQRASEAEFDGATGLTPTVAIGQQRPSANPRSSVATMTEILDDYRLLYARAGTRYCPRCGERLDAGRCAACGFAGSRQLTASMFSPNSEHGACAHCHGLGFVLDADPSRLVTDSSRALAGGAMAGHKTGRFYGDPHGQHMAILAAVGRALDVDFSVAWKDLDERAQAIAMRGAGERVFEVEWHYARGTRTGVHHFSAAWPGLQHYVRQEYGRKHADRRGDALAPLMTEIVCDECGGGKLKPEYMAVRFAGLNIAELLARTVADSLQFFEASPVPARPELAEATSQVIAHILARLRRLRDAALDYLTLDRPARSLSGGEAQRVRLASALDCGLTGITYVLDEPTVGLHPRDTERLIGLVRSLADAGNTVVVVEHDRDVIAAADQVIELGPGAGAHGGRIVVPDHEAEDGPIRVRSRPPSASGFGELVEARSDGERAEAGEPIRIRGAHAHNLRHLDVEMPTRRLVVVSGVSGSGKSSLVFDVLAASLERGQPVNCTTLDAGTRFASVISVDRARSATSRWSNTATHTGIFDLARDLFAATDAAKARGFTKKHFAIQAPGGRCEVCEGLGQTRISMDFLPDIWVTCEACRGARYIPDVLDCTIRGASIGKLLDLAVEEARPIFGGLHGAAGEEIVRRLDILRDAGLGYLHLGQPARTLSGGERQRLHLARALMDPAAGPSIYLFDEPTIGLHTSDVRQLLRLFDRLVEAGHTLVLVEHNLDVIRAADHVIDLGPEGGPGGGEIVAAGPPAAIASEPRSYTGQALKRRS